MIITSIITAFLLAIPTLIFFIPFHFPAMPAVIVDGLSFITDNIGNVVNVGRYILTPTFFTAIITMAIALLSFDFLYGLTMWVLRKLPFINIH